MPRDLLDEADEEYLVPEMTVLMDQLEEETFEMQEGSGPASRRMRGGIPIWQEAAARCPLPSCSSEAESLWAMCAPSLRGCEWVYRNRFMKKKGCRQ